MVTSLVGFVVKDTIPIKAVRRSRENEEGGKQVSTGMGDERERQGLPFA